MNFIKKSLSFLISSTILFNTVYAKQNDSNDDSNFYIPNYENSLEETAIEDNQWARNSKSEKMAISIFLGLGFALPIIMMIQDNESITMLLFLIILMLFLLLIYKINH